MIAIGRYLLIIMSLAVMTLSVEGRINEEDVNKFLDDIFIFHNKYRQEHGVAELDRTIRMDHVAARILDDMFTEQHSQNYDLYGKNNYEKMYNEDTKLSTSEAEWIFMEWYKKGSSYNYFFEPVNNESHNIFTQIVWKDTQTFGIALRLTHNKYVVQVVYLPRGNIPGNYESNVFQRPIIPHRNSSELDWYIYDNDRRIFKDYIFYLHNVVRIEHRVPLLQRSEDLDAFADDILSVMSNNMYQCHDMYGKNYLDRNYHNNTILNKAEAEIIFLEWYNKGANYDYNSEPLNSDAAEFTQIVWMGTQRMGLSMLVEDGFYRVLVFYDPPGNIQEQFGLNVLKPQNTDQ